MTSVDATPLVAQAAPKSNKATHMEKAGAILPCVLFHVLSKTTSERVEGSSKTKRVACRLAWCFSTCSLLSEVGRRP